MAKKEEGYSGSSFWQLMLVIPGVIIGFTLVIAVLAHFLGPSAAPSAASPAMEAAAAKVEENVKPVADVEVAQAETAHVEKSGEEVVKAVCSMCHAAGLMESPKIGDKGQWGPRIAQGYETLVQHAIQGIRNMPPKGGNPALTDGEIAAAVANMANQAGANFDPATLKK
jgi:cytochrome c5